MEDIRKMGFCIDMTACIGCRTCQIACKDKSGLPVGIYYRRVTSYETGRYPNPGYYHYSASCNHCTYPKCVERCPTGATYISEEDATVQYDDSICIRCRYCVNACPYGVPQYFKTENKVGKCDACLDLRKADKNPVCVDACMMRAIEWGVLEEMKEKYEQDKLTSDIAVLPSSMLTRPSVLIKPSKHAQNKDYVEVEI